MILALDIGGTKVMAGLLDGKPRILKSLEFPTPKNRHDALKELFKNIDALLKSDSRVLEGIGIAAPGPLDVKKGILLKAPNLPGWESLPIKSLLAKRYKVPTFVENDANAAALAEALWGAGKNYRFVFYATLSTGIGAGFVMDKKIYQGRTGMALEAGHASIDYQGLPCKCGLKGCIEAYASGPSIVKRARNVFKNTPEKFTSRDIQRMAEQGDKKALKLIKETGFYIGVWLGNIVNILDPDAIVLGGGVSFFGKPLFDAIRETLPKFSINPNAHKIPIVPAKLKRDVGLFGAAALCLISDRH